MCTLTWWRENDRYSLFFNRDELKTRKPALPPQLREDAGVRFITPVDGDHGGTWLLVNAFGLSIAILNNYEADPPDHPGHTRSRGQLVLSLARHRTVDDVDAVMKALSPEEYRPFHLFVLGPSAAPVLWTWRGDHTRLTRATELNPPITTSSFRPQEVQARRIARFAAIPAGERTPEALEDFHHGTDPENSAFSVRMRRPDAQTVSFSKIEVVPDSVSFTYRPEPVDSLRLLESVRRELARQRA